MSVTVFVVLWVALVAIVLSLALYRRILSGREDGLVHVLEGDAHLISQQVAMTEKLNLIDHWGKLLTVLAFVYGLVLAGVFLYQGWLDSSHL